MRDERVCLPNNPPRHPQNHTARGAHTKCSPAQRASEWYVGASLEPYGCASHPNRTAPSGGPSATLGAVSAVGRWAADLATLGAVVEELIDRETYLTNAAGDSGARGKPDQQ